MKPLNKKINKVCNHNLVNKSFFKIHSIYKDLRYWEWLYLEIENNKLELHGVLSMENTIMYDSSVSNTINIPSRTGKNYGKK